MSMVAAWAVFPALIVVLATGCGLLLEAVAGRRMPGPLGPVAGLALIIVVGQLIGTAIVMAVLLQPELEQFQSVAYIAMIAFAVTLIVSFVVLFRVFFAPPSRDDQ